MLMKVVFIFGAVAISLTAAIQIQIDIPGWEGGGLIQDFDLTDTLDSVRLWVKSVPEARPKVNKPFLFMIASVLGRYHLYSDEEYKLSLKELEERDLMYPNATLTLVNLVPSKYSPFILKEFKKQML